MKGSKYPISWLALGGILMACGLGAYFLIPNDQKVMDRLVKDGNYERALQYLQGLPSSVTRKDSAGFKLRELELKRRLLDERKQAALAAHLKETLAAYQSFSDNPVFLSEVTRAIALLDDLEEAQAIVVAQASHLPVAGRYTLTEALVRQALRLDKPQTAAGIFQRFWESSLPKFSSQEKEEHTSEMVRLWRLANQPAKGLEALDRYEQAAGVDLFVLSPGLGQLKLTLLREIGRAADACNLIRAFIKARGYDAAGPGLVDLMLKTAAESDLQDDLLPDFRELAAQRPTDTNLWHRFGQLAISASLLDDATNAFGHLSQLAPESRAYIQQLAQLYEWKDQPNLAFDLNLKLARQGDLQALDNLRELNPGLYRGRELLEVMRSLAPVMTQEKYRIPMAELLIEHGEYEESEKYLEMHLAKHPDDTVVLRKYAKVLEEEFQFTKLLPVQRRLTQLLPQDEEAETKLAEVYYLTGDFDQAFQTYLKLRPKTTNLDTIENCGTLAQALGEYEEYTRSLERRIEVRTSLAQNPDSPLRAEAVRMLPSDWSDLGDSYHLRGQALKQAEVLSLAVARFPESETLRFQLVLILSDLKRYGELAHVLEAHPEFKKDLNLIHLYLNALVEGEEVRKAANFLKTMPPEFLTSSELTGLLGTIYEKTGNHSAALKLFRTLYQEGGKRPSETSTLNLARALNEAGEHRPALQILTPLLNEPKGEALKLAAKIFGDLGQFKDAESFQRRYLAETKNPSSQDWGFLGDIYSATGNKSEARKAYAHAVAIIEKEHKSVNQ